MNINEIARLSGVSSATVSRYFNNGYVSKEKRALIKEAVDKTGYHPLLQAQTLRTKKTKSIGVILPRIDSYAMGKTMSGILEIMDKEDYRVVLSDTQNNPQKELEYLAVFSEKQVDGIILVATVITNQHLRMLDKIEVPVVIVGQRVNGCYCVYNDDYNASYEMTKLLIDKNAEKFAYIGALEADIAVGQERRRGYLDALNEAGIEVKDESYIISGFGVEDGHHAAKQLWESCSRPDAIICATDNMAIGAIKYLKEQGIAVPGDVMVTGHGDSITAQISDPTLTTVHYYYRTCGSTAAKMLLDLLCGLEMGIREIKMGYYIVENGSTAGEREAN